MSMIFSVRLLVGALLATLLCACGPNGKLPLATSHSAAPQRNLAQPGAALFDADALMDFGEASYGALFVGHQPPQDTPPYRYRYYPATNTYLGLSGYDVYARGAFTNDQISRVGGLRDFVCAAYVQDCKSRLLWPQGAWSVASFTSPPVVSSFPQAPLTPLASPRSVANNKSFFYRYGYPRSWAVADLTGDGLDDLIVAPTFFDQEPRLPIQLWINKGDGTFEDRTSMMIGGAVPTVGVPVAILVADFNGDGRPDIFISDSGLETCAGSDVCPGSSNTLLLSGAEGRLVDVSATNLPNNVPRFNHVVAAVGDLNGDGFPDIAVPNLGGATSDGSGVVLWLNDGQGKFTDRTNLLDDEVAHLPYSYTFSGARPSTYDRQSTGVAGIMDIDGDGKAELLTCSYSNDRYSKTDTLRVHKWNAAAGKVQQVKKIPIMPAELAATSSEAATGGTIPYENKIGCSGISVADVDGDGIKDLVLSWEKWDEAYIQVARGTGDLTFEDVTLKWLGRYVSNFFSQGYKRSVFENSLADIDGDDKPDLLVRAGGLTNDLLATGNPVVLQNTGAFFAPHTLQTTGTALTQEQVNAMLGGCSYCAYQPVFGRFTRSAASRLDMALIITNQETFSSPVQESKVIVRVVGR